MATAQAWKVLNTDPRGDGGFLEHQAPPILCVDSDLPLVHSYLAT